METETLAAKLAKAYRQAEKDHGYWNATRMVNTPPIGASDEELQRWVDGYPYRTLDYYLIPSIEAVLAGEPNAPAEEGTAEVWLVRYTDEDSSGVLAVCETEEVANAIKDREQSEDEDCRYYYSVSRKALETTLDPKPWVYALFGDAKDGYTPAREAEQVTGGFVFRPRKGFIQDRKAYGV